MKIRDAARPVPTALMVLIFACCLLAAATEAPVQARIDKQLERGQPIVVHVVVALCDNKYQGIVKVPASLGNGQDPDANLYWGAAYGVRTFLAKTAGWEMLSREAAPKSTTASVLERIVLHTKVRRAARSADVILVAEAWDGAKMKEALTRFLRIAGGNDPEDDSVVRPGRSWRIEAGGAANLVAFVGHNGLMDAQVGQTPPRLSSPPRAAIVLACSSKDYFLDRLKAAGASGLLLTTGLMAPEAYSLDAAVRSFASGDSPSDTLAKVSARYAKYQNSKVAAARALFYCDAMALAAPESVLTAPAPKRTTSRAAR